MKDPLDQDTMDLESVYPEEFHVEPMGTPESKEKDRTQLRHPIIRLGSGDYPVDLR